jgi:hypothetical protein
VSPACFEMALRTSALIGDLCVPSPRAMNELRKGWPLTGQAGEPGPPGVWLTRANHMSHVDGADGKSREERDLPAGDFSAWMIEMQGALRGERGSDVPCGGCTACCTSSQFIHIGPDETDTLSHIPAALLFPAPRLPRGHVVLGYDEHGHCPMLIDATCSIYEHRPRTCRTYDCRVFPAAGLGIDDGAKVLIDRQARRWQFSFPTHEQQNQHDAVQAAATFLRDHAGSLPNGAVPTDATQLAVLAIELHDTFLRRDDEKGHTTVVDPEPEVIRVELIRRREARDATCVEQAERWCPASIQLDETRPPRATVRARIPSVARSAPSDRTGKMPASFHTRSMDDQS